MTERTEILTGMTKIITQMIEMNDNWNDWNKWIITGMTEMIWMIEIKLKLKLVK